MRDGLETEEMQQIQPLLHTEEINSTSVWPIIHMIRAVCSILLSVVFFLLTPALGCYGDLLIVSIPLRV